jgi:cyclopropane fatty-acyl-phospholipid synthase-like methyltransferase
MTTPTKSSDFDRAYRAPFTVWGDVRIPAEVQNLARQENVQTSLELGCGTGRFTRFMSQQGVRATGVDFSPVAIAKAQKRVAQDSVKPSFIVSNVTHLDALTGPFDISFDVGCFHCLDLQGQCAYISEVSRLLKPGGTHLVWALDAAPSGIRLSPAAVGDVFAPAFELQSARKNRRRLALSHWYWLVRR